MKRLEGDKEKLSEVRAGGTRYCQLGWPTPTIVHSTEARSGGVDVDRGLGATIQDNKQPHNQQSKGKWYDNLYYEGV